MPPKASIAKHHQLFLLANDKALMCCNLIWVLYWFACIPLNQAEHIKAYTCAESEYIFGRVMHVKSNVFGNRLSPTLPKFGLNQPFFILY